MMISLALALSLMAIPQQGVSEDSVRLPAAVATADVPQDTVRRRPRAIEVSEWYHRRLVIHKTLSYAIIPVFAAQYIAGSKLYDQSAGPAPSWAKPVHQTGAKAVAGIFGVNTVTGLWNLWDSRAVTEHRWLRIGHAAAMIGADAAFAYTGLKLSDEAGISPEGRRRHRQVALYSIGLTVGSGVAMKVLNK